jgi:hypothetical protein
LPFSAFSIGSSAPATACDAAWNHYDDGVTPLGAICIEDMQPPMRRHAVSMRAKRARRSRLIGRMTRRAPLHPARRSIPNVETTTFCALPDRDLTLRAGAVAETAGAPSSAPGLLIIGDSPSQRADALLISCQPAALIFRASGRERKSRPSALFMAPPSRRFRFQNPRRLPSAGCVNVVDCNGAGAPPIWGMIRPEISNAVVISILFATVAGGATLLVVGAPALHRAAAAVEKCDAPDLMFRTQDN